MTIMWESWTNSPGIVHFGLQGKLDKHARLEAPWGFNGILTSRSITNRLYAKRDGQVSEVLSWELSQVRYFDPFFGGAVVPGQRNEFLSSIELTPYAFIDQALIFLLVVQMARMKNFQRDLPPSALFDT